MSFRSGPAFYVYGTDAIGTFGYGFCPLIGPQVCRVGASRSYYLSLCVFPVGKNQTQGMELGGRCTEESVYYKI